MWNIKRKYVFLIFGIFSSILFTLYYFNVFSLNYTNEVEQFQKKFTQKCIALDEFILQKQKALREEKEIGKWKDFKENPPFYLHVYRNDSIVFWNTNQLPIHQFTDIHFPSSGIFHLQNGWYYGKTITFKNYQICASFPLKSDYSFENDELINQFTKSFDLSFSAFINLEQDNGYPIYNVDKSYAFSILPNEYQTANEEESLLLMFFLLSSFLCFLLYFYELNQEMSVKWDWLIPAGIFILRYFSLKFIWLGFLHDTTPFQSSLYGTSEWFPNFFEFLLNILLIFFFMLYLRRKITQVKKAKGNLWLYAMLLVGFVFWYFILYINEGLIENSSIPLNIAQLFGLSVYSLLALIAIGLLQYSYFLLLKRLFKKCKDLEIPIFNLILWNFSFGILFFAIVWFRFNEIWSIGIFPLLFNTILIFFVYREKKSFQLGFGLMFLSLVSLITAVNLAEFNERKNKSERELFANQLATEKDIVTEVEYSALAPKIQRDALLQSLVKKRWNINALDLQSELEKNYFNGFWERYELTYAFFDYQNESVLRFKKEQKNNYDYLENLIRKHGSQSEIDTNMYFINDYTGQFAYIIKQPIFDADSTQGTLYCTLKSKKIPEAIGFPRLLISAKAKVLSSLENYSIAKYHKGLLTRNYGDFIYPSNVRALTRKMRPGNNFFDYDGYNHILLNKSKKDIVVLSSENFTFTDLLTSFSYLFSFYGILILPLLFQFKKTPLLKRTISLAVKIQLVLIGLVFISLFAFGWGSGLFVSNQYHNYTSQIIREKMQSVHVEIQNAFSNEKYLTIDKDANELSFLLKKLSKVFVTDINIYDTKGFLLSSSQPRIFNLGLISEQINPEAYYALQIKDKSEYIHQENIGQLDYSSAYLPFYTADGNLLGFINLQHFGQQTEFENQIQQFLVAIINVFMFLFAISIVIAIFISNWVTAPLRLLQESLTSVKFGKINQQIEYDKDDEIGALVKDYNKKLEELQFTAQQLALSERESAWREMAKQVAHEIKNPLTPMKLSVQQLLRVYDPNDPNAAQKLEKVSKSIIEQIDALTKIANEFSTFAKMPKPNEIRLDLLPLIENVIEVFKNDEHIDISFETLLKEAWVQADKDQMVRVFNNLIKNAIQAIPSEREGKIKIYLIQNETTFLIHIEDNGKGIEAHEKSKIFVPYFTTKSTGTGLGLAMVKQIIENHNGQISYSTSPLGTIFTIQMPMA